MARSAPTEQADLARRHDWRQGVSPATLIAVLLVVAAIALAWAPMDAAWVERVYSRAWYPAIQPIVTSLASLAPIALLDVWIVCALLALLWSGWRVVARAVWHARRARRRRAGAWRGGRRGGLPRVPGVLGTQLSSAADHDGAGLRSRARHAAEVDAVSRRAVTELNRLHQSAHADLRTSPTLAAMRVRLAPAFAAAQRALGRERLATAGRPKISMLSPFFRWATVDGMVNPLGPRGDREPRGAASGAAVRDRARVGPPGRLGARKRGQLCRLAHVS